MWCFKNGALIFFMTWVQELSPSHIFLQAQVTHKRVEWELSLSSATHCLDKLYLQVSYHIMSVFRFKSIRLNAWAHWMEEKQMGAQMEAWMDRGKTTIPFHHFLCGKAIKMYWTSEIKLGYDTDCFIIRTITKCDLL